MDTVSRILRAQRVFLSKVWTAPGTDPARIDKDFMIAFAQWLRVNDPDLADEYAANRVALRLQGLLNSKGEIK